MHYTSADVMELARLLAAPGLDDLTAVRLARNDVSNGLVETAVLRLKAEADKIRPICRPLYNIITNW
ncbi:hypothetical protein SAMN05880566_12342 [Janthinobacterium sp. TND4EL3]|uniref:hypothetical protein n=1 Tax=Janthinobacterium sp. TND4EL3 TaxID=1907311 RepID=UPI000955E2B3|nr:hypothetical protein [Janthinobacterium sp. TND4EL3]SIR80832.1 hypothetical protein SAMN05880566_12342 [Janthinobacterium sp. TND4EL3]